jgi:hypothetical protein
MIRMADSKKSVFILLLGTFSVQPLAYRDLIL